MVEIPFYSPSPWPSPVKGEGNFGLFTRLSLFNLQFSFPALPAWGSVVMNYKRFEDLPCWQKARELCRAVFELINQKEFRKDFGLRNQIWEASGSVMDNIAEGFDDGSTREFIRFLGYAQRSSSEVQSQLYRAMDCRYIIQPQFDNVYDLASDCRKQIKGLRRYLRNYDTAKKNS